MRIKWFNLVDMFMKIIILVVVLYVLSTTNVEGLVLKSIAIAGMVWIIGSFMGLRRARVIGED